MQTNYNPTNLNFHEQPNAIVVLQIPLTVENMLGLTLVGFLAMIGITYVWVLYSRKKCRCRLCRGDLVLGECIGRGGFGEVYKVTFQKKVTGEKNLTKFMILFGQLVPYLKKMN